MRAFEEVATCSLHWVVPTSVDVTILRSRILQCVCYNEQRVDTLLRRLLGTQSVSVTLLGYSYTSTVPILSKKR